MKNNAQEILNYVGGQDNIIQFTHCATRLRFVVKNESKVEFEKLNELKDVISSQKANGQIQVIVGGKVVELFDDICKLLPENAISKEMVEEQEGDAVIPTKKNPISLVVDTICQIFSPILPVLVGCGLSKAFINTLVKFGVVASGSDVVIAFTMVSDLVFYFMPFLLAVSTAEKFKTNKFLALTTTGILMSNLMMTSATNGTELSFLGFNVLVRNYSSTIIPAILTTIVLSYIYKTVNKILPVMIRSIFTPVITLIIMTPITLLVTGPIGYHLGVYVAEFITGIYSIAGVFGPFILGLLRSPLTVLGLHYSIGPIQVTEIASVGFSVLLPTALCSNIAQAGATMGIAILSKNKEEKVGALSASVTALCGITEPAMFGYTLKYKTPFMCSCLAAAISSTFMSFFHAKGFATGLPSLLTLVNFGTEPEIFLYVGVALSFILSCIFVLITGINRKENKLFDKIMGKKA